MDFQKKIQTRKCAALGCPVTSDTHPHVRLFNFPRQHEGKLIRYNKWVQFSNNPSLIIGKLKSASLCSGHFRNRCFKTLKREILQRNAVPTIRNSQLKIKKPVNRAFSINKKRDCNSNGQTSKSGNRPINFNTITSRLIFNNNFTGIFKKSNDNRLIIEHSQNIERSHSSREEKSTTLLVNTLSKLFGKPPDITSNVSFDKWITFAKNQNIICEQIEYALCTAKRVSDFMRPMSPIENNEPFYGFEDVDSDSDSDSDSE